ncbi:uncharacterized protein J8A68_004091 [[Candida] subhashii]|uniref:Kinetochore protein mis13 n=1 Tax=[Candida] subhashii TaxID=561895 RepID=A0A8J5QI10_9ASCO|nr:uncharacterized protein J8A68_004091 [[Candida] subhashii]KAG7662443.1 hypothetical protein J8A68_004091 [[Candida] subhashii]
MSNRRNHYLQQTVPNLTAGTSTLTEANQSMNILSRENKLSNLFTSSSQEHITTSRNTPSTNRHESSRQEKKRKRLQIGGDINTLNQELELLSEADETIDFSQFKTRTQAVGTKQTKTTSYRPESKSSKRTNSNNRYDNLPSSGIITEPLKNIDVKDYHKFLDPLMSEPDKMRQLLIWCMKKEMEDDEQQPHRDAAIQSDERTAYNIAKVVKEEIIKDLIEQEVSTNWYDSNNTNLNSSVLLPNPQNTSTLLDIETYSKQLEQLREEKMKWRRAFESSINEVNQIRFDPDKINKDKLSEYIQTHHPDKKGIVDNSLINKTVAKYESTKKLIPELERKINQLSASSYMLESSTRLIKNIEDKKILPDVERYLSDYMNKASVENYKLLQEKEGVSHWPIPTEPITDKELLEGICRVEMKAAELEEI